ncbi:MAG: dTMP kinase [Candidatus Nanoarchaeia archaeon]|nr:dTMP kinase [Candidatus Nanoarchaeia archaeon]
MAKLLVLEGTDGAGKGTQSELVKEYLKDNNKSFKFFHFPMYGHNKFSEMIARFLRGEFGSIEEVSPYFVANLYAMDRFMFLPELKKAMDENYIVLLDRYVYSNIAYQGAKYLLNSDENKDIRRWIYQFEFGFLKLPKPDLNIFFDVPIEIIKQRLESNREGTDREYLNGKKDIHESDINFQNEVRSNYLSSMDNTGNRWDNHCKIISCIDNQNKLFNPLDLFNSYKKYIDEIL